MVTGLGILLVSFVGVNLYDHYRGRRLKLTHKTKSEPEPERAPARGSNIVESEALCNRYFLISLASLSFAVLARSFPILNILSLGFIIYTCIPILKRGQRQLFNRRTIGHDFLFSAYVIMAFLTGQELFIALGVFFYHTGAKVLAMNQARSKPVIASLFEQQSDKIWIIKDGIEIETALTDVVAGDIAVVGAGESVPVDGVITQGMAMIDQHALTGESQPVEKGRGDAVLSSTLIVSGRIQVEVARAGKETTIAEIAEILNNTSAYTTSIQLKGERWANYIAIPIVALSAVTIPLKGLLAATTVIHSTFGNRLRIAAPIGTLSYLHAAFNKGLLIKDGRVIEELNEVDTVLFDKTGTLTYDQPEVGAIICADDRYGANEVLTYAATAEFKLDHPLAKAIVNKAKESHLQLPAIEDSLFTMGYGISVTIGDRLIRVGSARFMEMEQISIPPRISAAIEHAHIQGSSLVLVAIETEVAGAIEIVSRIRAEVQAILTGLRKRGIKHISVVSGDHKNPTQRLAEALDLDSYHYEVLPQQKASIVEEFQRQGRKVCYVGDGINDTIAMNTANVSISLSGATSVATDTAQAILMDGSLTHLCDLFDVARKLRNNLWRSLFLVTVPSAISVGGAIFWGLRLGGSYLIIYSSFALALANAMLPGLGAGKNRETNRRPDRGK